MNRVEACRSRSSRRFTAPVSAAGSSSRSPVTTASPPIIPRPSSAFPRCSSASFPAPAAASACRASSALRAALDMILAGKTERAAKARRLGLVDELVPAGDPAGRRTAAAPRLAQDGIAGARAEAGRRQAGCSTAPPPGRRWSIAWREKQLLTKTGGHYPAPLAALDAVRVSLSSGMAAGLASRHSLRRARRERRVAQAGADLLRHHRAQEGRRRPARHARDASRPWRASAWSGPASWARGSRAPRCSTSRWTCGIRTPTSPRVGKGIRAATGILDERLKRRRLTRPQHERLTALLSGSADDSGFRGPTW